MKENKNKKKGRGGYRGGGRALDVGGRGREGGV